jgi:hypothetical protein
MYEKQRFPSPYKCRKLKLGVDSSIMLLKVPKNIGTFKWSMKISLNLLANFEKCWKKPNPMLAFAIEAKSYTSYNFQLCN